MKILKDIELIDLAIYTNKTLIFTDFHIGYEESLNKQGLMVPRFQFDEIMKRLEKIFSRLKGKKIDKIIVNGDLKHEFSTISDQEWRHTLKLLDFFEKHCNEIILIKGNHDTILGPIAKKRNIRVMDHFIINNILIIHGDVIPSKTLLKGVKTIIIGHEHPAVSVREGPRAELFKAFLVGKWKKYNLVVQPSFNLVTEGTDVLKEEVLIPFLKGNLRNLNAIIVGDKLYNFGKIKDLN
ncbi:phosphoesterase [Candidatus Woesearchaeota archaeon]|nr:phosphoesterase [Candidatus Woesearchaeota archaeon]